MHTFSLSRLVVMLACSALTQSLARGAEGAGVPEPPRPAAPSVRVLRHAQQGIGRQLESIHGGLLELLEEVQENLVADEMGADAAIAPAASKLGQIADEQIPRIVDGLATPDGTRLRAAAEGQDEVVRTLDALLQRLQRLKRELDPLAARRALEVAIRKQEDARSATADLRRDGTAEGQPAERLNTEERRALGAAGLKQADAGQEIGKLLGNLDRWGAERPDLRALGEDLRRGGLPEHAGGAARDLGQNKLGGAEEKQRTALGLLRGALGRLDPDGPATADERRLKALTDLRDRQVHALDETAGLKPGDEEGVTRVAKEQGHITSGLTDAGAAPPQPNSPAPTPGTPAGQPDPLGQAIKHSASASAKIAGDMPGPAQGHQNEVLKILAGEIAKTAARIASAKDARGQGHGQPGAPGQPDGQAPGDAQPGQPGAPSTSSAPAAHASPQGATSDHGTGPLAYGLLAAAPREAGWNVALPERDRGAVEQAVRQKMPVRFIRQIQTYYENLAGSARGE